VIAAGFAFAVTCLVSVAASLGDAHGPMNQWAIRYGTTVVTVEAAILIASALLAMTIDRRITVRQGKDPQAHESGAGEHVVTRPHRGTHVPRSPTLETPARPPTHRLSDS
jgi:hypothetical protein